MNKLPKLSLKARYQIIKRYKQIYQKRKTGKKEKTKILNTVVELCGFNRWYACFLLNKKHLRRKKMIKRKREEIYDKKVLNYLVKLWRLSDFSCGKLLKSQIKLFLPFYEKEYGIIEEEAKGKLLAISPATIDRLLKQQKKKEDYRNLKGKSYKKKKDKILENLIPIKTHTDWNFKVDKPGKLQIDLVSHDGGSIRGDFIQTLTMVDYITGWSVLEACLNKAALNVFPQLKICITLFPFTVFGIHSDSGVEFINAHLFRFCCQNNIVFTRSRPYKKDDNFWVENRNDKLVRRNVGYCRYEGRTDLFLLNLLYEKLYLYLNFFKPQRRCLKKEKFGSKMRKLYDQPQTPYQRVLKEKSIPKENKIKLKTFYQSLNPIEIKKEIVKLQNLLLEDEKIKKVFVRKYQKIQKKNFRLDFN
jgi:hypothetical protein